MESGGGNGDFDGLMKLGEVIDDITGLQIRCLNPGG